MTLKLKEVRSIELHSRFPEMLQRLISSDGVNVENVIKTNCGSLHV